MYKLIFKLKQHTPLIHFQYAQHRATLRATELKPKLDKFLINKLKLTENNKQKKEFKHWFNNADKLSLDYKVRIVNNDTNQEKGTVKVMPSHEEKWLLSSDLQIEFTCFVTDLLTEIEKNINLFFVLHNFGKRQSKGFGCFYLNDLKEDNFVSLIKNEGRALFKSENNLKSNIQNSTYFYDREINPAWSRLKSGKNFRGYEKSRVFDYMKDNNLRWDKRWIKKQLKDLIDNGTLPAELKSDNDPIDINGDKSWHDNSNEKYSFGRAMLGLAEHYEYIAYDRYTYQVKVKSSNIERFKSPVTFKIFNKSIYAFAEQIDKKMFDEEFSFEVVNKRNNSTVGKPITISRTLNTPNNQNFNLDMFLNSYFRTVGYHNI